MFIPTAVLLPMQATIKVMVANVNMLKPIAMKKIASLRDKAIVVRLYCINLETSDVCFTFKNNYV